MTIQNQLNRIIQYLASTGDCVVHVEISKSNAVRCYGAKSDTTYYTVWSIFSSEEIEQMELDDMEQRADRQIADEEQIANEVYQSIEDERVEREFGPNY